MTKQERAAELKLLSGTKVENCMKCGACVKACPHQAMRFPQEDFRIVHEDCIQEFGSDEHVPEYLRVSQAERERAEKMGQ